MKDTNSNYSEWYRIEKVDSTTMIEFFCCGAVGFSGATAMFVFTIAGHPIRVFILILSTFFFQFSLVISSIIFYIIPIRYILFHLISSVLIQEFFRLFMYIILSSIERATRIILTAPTLSVLPSLREISYVSGLGFGIMSSSIQLVDVLSMAKGPGTLGLNGGYEYFGLVSAIISSLFVILHTSWGIISFKGFMTMNSRLPMHVVGFHLAASCSTILMLYDSVSFLTIPFLMIITVISSCYSYVISGGSLNLFMVAVYHSIFRNCNSR